MEINADICYQALLTRDRRFDGLFYVAVKSTRIYCRPVCTVKPPAKKGCTFYENAASCERDGYRPCLRCRPELAPGKASVDIKSYLVTQAVNRIEDGALANNSLEDLALDLGITSRHLRRIFESEVGVTPVQFVQTQRLLLAKRLLTDTTMPISQVAMASGFASLRRFNALFIERYRLNPSQLRKSSLSKEAHFEDSFSCLLPFRPPFDWQSILAFLRGRACPSVELVDDVSYKRTVSIEGAIGWVSVSLSTKPCTLIVNLSSTLAPKLLIVLNRLKRLFDLQANPELIEQTLGALAQPHPGLRVPGAFDPFEVAIRAIVGQQVSVKAASTLVGRIAKEYGVKTTTPYPELNLLTPTATDLSKADPSDLAKLGILLTRSQTIVALSKRFASGEVRLEPGMDYQRTVDQLTSTPGIGHWTAEYIAMRCLVWPDAFPHDDLGIKKSLGLSKKQELLSAVEKYRPWRAYAAMHIWKGLEIPVAPLAVPSRN